MLGQLGKESMKLVVLAGIMGLTLFVLHREGIFESGRVASRFFKPAPGIHQTLAQKKQALAYTHYLAGLIKERRGEFLEAVEEFRTAKGYDPESTLVRVYLGVNLVYAGKREEAAEEFEAASRQNPDDPKVKILTALLFASQKNYSEAIEQFKMVVEQNPENVFALSSLADLYILFNELEEAVEIYHRIIEFQPRTHLVYFNLAVIQSRLSLFADAQTNLEKAVKLAPQHVESWAALGLMHEIQGRTKKAIWAYEKALDVNPVYIKMHGPQALLGCGHEEFKKIRFQTRQDRLGFRIPHSHIKLQDLEIRSLMTPA